jgi:hypothetical protein
MLKKYEKIYTCISPYSILLIQSFMKNRYIFVAFANKKKARHKKAYFSTIFLFLCRPQEL